VASGGRASARGRDAGSLTARFLLSARVNRTATRSN
jgi:hypothetical protein